MDFGIGASGKLKAFLLTALAVFMSSLAFGIVSAPMGKMHPVLGFLLKSFILLVFGGISAFCIGFAIQSLRGGPKLPPDVLSRCPTCGEKTPGDLVCPVCGELPHDRKLVYRVESEGLWGHAIGAIILAGVGCLGLFIMIGPYLDGERRLWALIAFAALGLLMLAVGIVGVFGFLLVLWERIGGSRTITFSCKGPDRYTHGSGKSRWGKVIGLEGHGQVTAPLAPRGRSEGGYRAAQGDVELAEAIATFDAAGIVDLGHVTTYEWRVGDPSGKTQSKKPEFHRTIDRMIMMILCNVTEPVFDPDDDAEIDAVQRVPTESADKPDSAILRFLGKFIVLPMDVRAFKSKLDADPIHRTQTIMHARVLRDRGIAVSNELVEAVVEGFAEQKVA